MKKPNSRPRNDIYESYVNDFLEEYPTPQARRRGAMHVARASHWRSKPEDEVPLAYNSHRQFVARWGETNEGIKDIAYDLYRASGRLITKKGQLVLSFVEGDHALFYDSVREGELLDHFTLQLGVSYDGDLRHDFGLRRTAEGTPALAYRMGILTTDTVTIDADVVGAPELLPESDAFGNVLLWSGSSPLEDDVAVYAAEASHTDYHTVRGTEQCLGIVASLAQITGQPGLYEQAARITHTEKAAERLASRFAA